MAILVQIRCPFLMIFAPYFVFVTVCMKTLYPVIQNPGFPQIASGIIVETKGLNLSIALSLYSLLVPAKQITIILAIRRHFGKRTKKQS